MQSGRNGQTTFLTVRTSKDYLLRAMQIVSGIVERRHEPHSFSMLGKVAAKRKAGPNATANANSDAISASSEQTNQTESGGASGDDGGEDGDPDSDRRHSHSKYPLESPQHITKSQRRPAKRRNSSQHSSLISPHQSALAGACLLFVLYLVVMMVFAFANQVELATRMLTGLPGIAWIIRCFVKPK